MSLSAEAMGEVPVAAQGTEPAASTKPPKLRQAVAKPDANEAPEAR